MAEIENKPVDTEPTKPAKQSKKKSRADESKMVLKTPKGTVDYNPWQMAVRQKITKVITDVFKRHGAVTIDTPVFELRETLMGKYGEDSKLIYDLQDQGGEICSLRYDLTVPFARYMAMNHLKTLKRYHIAKVYRRDNPAMTKGRYREFYQCDFDIAGQYETMIPDAECLAVVNEALNTLDVGNFIIKVNHRKLLDGIFAIAGVPEEKFRPICSAVDKLDKLPWDEVQKEMCEQKGLDVAVAEKIKEFVLLNGEPRKVLKELIDSKRCESSKDAMTALSEMGLLFDYLEAMECDKNVSFDLSLARGLDYYTGLVFEATFVGAQVGSISGGGRYDNLVGIFGREQIPAVGFSLGLERIFAIAEEKEKKSKDQTRTSETLVMVSAQGGFLSERLSLCSLLWKNNISAELLYKNKATIKQQLSKADELGCPFAVIIGENEIKDGIVQLKNLKKAIQVTIRRDDLVEAIKSWADLNSIPEFIQKVEIKKEEKKE